MKIIENTILPPKGYKAITLGPFIFIRKGTVLSKRDINHEAIHWQQYKETLIVGFLIFYVLEFIMKFISPSLTVAEERPNRSYWNRVYHSLSFEEEAYANQDNPDYLRTRQPYSWIKYIS